MKIPLLPNNDGKKSVNDAVPQQGHDKQWEQIFKGGEVCYKKGWAFATLNKTLPRDMTFTTLLLKLLEIYELILLETTCMVQIYAFVVFHTIKS